MPFLAIGEESFEPEEDTALLSFMESAVANPSLWKYASASFLPLEAKERERERAEAK